MSTKTVTLLDELVESVAWIDGLSCKGRAFAVSFGCQRGQGGIYQLCLGMVRREQGFTAASSVEMFKDLLEKFDFTEVECVVGWLVLGSTRRTRSRWESSLFENVAEDFALEVCLKSHRFKSLSDRVVPFQFCQCRCGVDHCRTVLVQGAVG